jgi:hypothetical protein
MFRNAGRSRGLRDAPGKLSFVNVANWPVSAF